MTGFSSARGTVSRCRNPISSGWWWIKPTPVWLQPGDVCRMEITGLGVLENPVKDA